MQVIARLGSLLTVNATNVTVYERRDSELRYMRSVLGMYFFSSLPSRLSSRHYLSNIDATLRQITCTTA